MSEQPKHVDSSAGFSGRVLITMGVLIVCVAGPCSLYFGLAALLLLFDPSAEIGGYMLFMVFVAGGVPLLVGFLLIRAGWKKLRRSRIKSNPPDDRA